MSYTDEIRNSVLYLRYAKGDINTTRLRYWYDRMIKSLGAVVGAVGWLMLMALLPWLYSALFVVPVYALLFIVLLISGSATLDAATFFDWLDEMGRWVLGVGFFFAFALLAQKFR